MSMTRSLFNEFRPFFRLFDEASRTKPSYSLLNRSFDRHFDEYPRPQLPILDLSEQGNEYIIEAELPGVKKEDVEVRIGDSGRSLTIEGRILARYRPSAESTPSNQSDVQPSQGNSSEVTKTSTDAIPISSEREFIGSSHFTRTIWLPRPVNESKVSGKLSDGILTLHIPKAEEHGSLKVDIQ